MKIKALSAILASLIIVAITSCSKTGPEGPSGPSGPSYTGSISGNITLADQYGVKVLTNLAGIKVTIVELKKTVKTDSLGHYLLTNVPTGNYTITYIDTTNTYGESEGNNVQFVVGDVNRDVKLSQIPVFKMASCTAVDTVIQGIKYVYLLCQDSVADTRQITLAVFVTADSTSIPNSSNYLVNYTEKINANKTQIGVFIPMTDFYAAGIAVGQKVYFGVYPAADLYATTSDFENIATGKEIYNAIGAKGVSSNTKVE